MGSCWKQSAAKVQGRELECEPQNGRGVGWLGGGALWGLSGALSCASYMSQISLGSRMSKDPGLGHALEQVYSVLKQGC